MDILVTICARGGSKGIKNKNIRPLLGKPLIGYTIEQAKKWGKAADIVVSTDSQEIAEAAKRLGAKVPFMRPSELADDASPKVPVIRHALETCEGIFKRRYEFVVDLDPTAPIRSAADIENSYRLFCERGPLTLFSVVKAHKNPYFNMVEEGEDGFVRLCKGVPGGVGFRQGAPDVYNMNASIYVYRREYLLDEKNTSPFSERSIVYVMNELSAFDIDREIDFKFIEFLTKEGIVNL